MLSEKAKVIGDQSAYPAPTGDFTMGMSYRDWLIGQCLNGTAVRVGGAGDEAFLKARTEQIASAAVSLVDSTLEWLALEQ